MEQQIKTVAVLGAGAVGAYFLWGLAPKLGENLWTVADGQRAQRLKAEGIIVNGERLRLNVRTPAEAHGADLLLVATKYGGLQQGLEDIAAVVGENTTVISLLNGVDSEELIAARIGAEHLLYSMIKISSERKGSSINFDPAVTLGVCYGEPGAVKDTPRMRAVARLFEGTEIHYRPSDRIFYEVWMKYAVNVRYNLVQAVLGVGVGAYMDSPHAEALSAALAEEVIAVAAARGIDISDARADQTLLRSRKAARYSTLQDLDAGRHTEIEMLAGAMVRMGQELGVPVPYSRAMLLLIKTLEEKNDGLFDY